MSMNHPLWLTQHLIRIRPGMSYICNMSWDISCWVWKMSPSNFYFSDSTKTVSWLFVFISVVNTLVHRRSHCRNPKFDWMLAEFTATIIELMFWLYSVVKHDNDSSVSQFSFFFHFLFTLFTRCGYEYEHLSVAVRLSRLKDMFTILS